MAKEKHSHFRAKCRWCSSRQLLVLSTFGLSNVAAPSHRWKSIIIIVLLSSFNIRFKLISNWNEFVYGIWNGITSMHTKWLDNNNFKIKATDFDAFRCGSQWPYEGAGACVISIDLVVWSSENDIKMLIIYIVFYNFIKYMWHIQNKKAIIFFEGC